MHLKVNMDETQNQTHPKYRPPNIVQTKCHVNTFTVFGWVVDCVVNLLVGLVFLSVCLVELSIVSFVCRLTSVFIYLFCRFVDNFVSM